MAWHECDDGTAPPDPMDDTLPPRRRKAGRLKQLNKHNRRQRAYQPESELLILSRRIEALAR